MAYWILSLALVGFGFIAAFSIGMPFLMLGGAMLMLGQVRHRTAVFWPPIVAVVAFNVGYWATVPNCGASSIVDSAGVGTSSPTCSSVLGGSTTTPGIYNPSLNAATDAGLLLAGLAFGVTLAVIFARRRRQSSGTGTPSTLKPPST